MSKKQCPECGCESIEVIDDEYGRCRACGFEEHISVFRE